MMGVRRQSIARGLVAAVGLAAAWWLTPACAPPPAGEGGFDSENPASKLYAIRDAGRGGDESNIPKLIEQLNSDDPAVRMFAIIALEKVTGERKGYDPYGPPWLRHESLQCWVEAYPPEDKASVAGENADNQP